MLTDLTIRNIAQRDRSETIRDVPVDNRFMTSFVSAALLDRLGVAPWRSIELLKSDGSIILRQLGAVLIEVGARQTVDDVVFALESDRTVLGWRALTGLGLKLDHATQTLVDAGPHPAATAGART